MAFMYILKCRDGSYYVGSTKDLTRRIEEHNHGEGAEYTRRRLPVDLFISKSARILKMHFYEKNKFKDGAVKREKH